MVKDATRDTRVPVRLSEQEHALLSEVANQQGMPLSTYLRVKGLEAAREEELEG